MQHLLLYMHHLWLLLDVNGSSDISVDKTVWLSHELLMEMKDVILHFFIGGNGARTEVDNFR